MEVILKQDVAHLGDKDELVAVKPGYGRNFLIPKGLAVLATKSAKKVHDENLRQRAHKIEKVRAEAEVVAQQLIGMSVSVGAKAGEGGKIFGSVNSLQLADALKKLGIEVDRKKVVIKNEPIKNLGSYEATIELHKGVSQTITFEVIEE